MARLPAPPAARTLQPTQVGGMARAPDASSNLKDLGQFMAVYAEKEQEKMDRVAVEEAYNELLTLQDELTWGEEGFTNVLAGDAVKKDLLKDYGQKREVKHNEILSRLSNRQKEAYNLRAAAAGREFSSKIMVHRAKQGDVHDTNVFNDTKALTYEAGARDPYNAAALEGHRARLTANALALADDQGRDPTAVVLDTLSGLHSSVIGSMLQEPGTENVKAAKKHLEAYGHEMTQEARDAAVKAVKQGSYKAEAFAAVDKAWDSGMSRADAMRSFRGLNPDARDKAEALWRQRENDRDAADRDRDQAAQDYYEAAAVELERGDGASYAERFMAGDFDGLTPAQRSNLQTIDTNRTKGVVYQTNWEVYSELATASDEELRKVNPVDHRTQLADSEFKKLVGLVDAAKNPSEKTRGKANRVRTFNQKTKTAITETLSLTEGDDRAVDFQERVQSESDRFFDENGRQMTASEEDELLRAMTVEVVMMTPTTIFNPLADLSEGKGFLYEVDSVEEIPTDDRSTLTQAFTQKNGRAPSDDELLSMYRVAILEGTDAD